RREDRFATATEVADALAPFAASDTSQSFVLPTREILRPGEPSATPDMSVPTPRELGTVGDEAMTESQLRGEVVPRTFGRNVALGLSGVALVAAAIGFVFMGRARRHITPSPPVVALAPESPLMRGKRLLSEGDLDGADKVLRAARETSDSAELQEA